MSDGSVSTADDADAFFYRCEADPLSTSWVRWSVRNPSRFNGQFGDLLTRRDGDAAIVRSQPHPALANGGAKVHGGAIMTFVDLAMFVGARVLGVDWAPGALTVDLSIQFAAAAEIEPPLDARLEITRETRKFLFVRGTIEQSGGMVASFIGLLRKAGGA